MSDVLILTIHCLIYNVMNVTALLLLIRKNPRYMMQDYPEEITRDLPPRTKEEKRGGLLYGLPFLLGLLLYPEGIWSSFLAFDFQISETVYVPL